MNKILVLLAFCFLLVGCEDDAKTAWTNVIKKCADNDLNGKTILYFGPSNTLGPGSVWREGNNGGYYVRYDLEQMSGHEMFINKGVPSTCDGTSTTKFGLKASIGLTSSVVPASGELVNDFKKAKDIQVKASSIAWDNVIEGSYETFVKTAPLSAIREDLDKNNRRVLSRALRISGYSATLEFNDSDAIALKGKYSGGLPVGDVGAEISTSWSSSNKLTITSTRDFYIAGELVPFKSGGFAAKGDAFGSPVNVSTDQPLVGRDSLL